MADKKKKEPSNIWEKSDAKKLEKFASDYRKFLDQGKTERECVSYMTKELKKAEAYCLDDLIGKKKKLKVGDLVYADMMKKSLVVYRIGKKPITEGLRFLGAHIDSPRMDLKQNPVYEDTNLAMLETHYYGGIKKYQWVTIPLALHGVIVKKNGKVVEINIGEKDDDPVFGVSDLLIHLSANQMKKTVAEAVTGENLNLMIGSIPLAGEEKEAVKANVLAILKKQYGIEEADFISAEIEVVPAGKSRDYGFDRSMIMGYGHDDRVCAYPSFRALMDVSAPEYTSVCVLVDKEEIGSVGATGMESRFFENTVAEMMELTGCYSDLALRRVLTRSKALSSDVEAAFDPNYPEVNEKNNTAYLGKGPCFNKYTGARGKSGSNDANAEYIAFLRAMLDKADIRYQTAELGKVDEGGGGTIAYILGNLGMEVIDCGVPVINMHAPWEIISKADLYEAYLAYKAFLK